MICNSCYILLHSPQFMTVSWYFSVLLHKITIHISITQNAILIFLTWKYHSHFHLSWKYQWHFHLSWKYHSYFYQPWKCHSYSWKKNSRLTRVKSSKNKNNNNKINNNMINNNNNNNNKVIPRTALLAVKKVVVCLHSGVVSDSLEEKM